MFERNKFAVTIVREIKDNIINNQNPNYNPVTLIGLNRIKRYEMFYRIFDKQFNSKHRDKIKYGIINNDIFEIKGKKLIIIEEVEKIINNEELQNKLLKLLLESDIQIILCLNSTIEELDIDDNLKSKMLAGIQVYLQD